MSGADIISSGTSTWHGPWKTGAGDVSTGSSVLKNIAYTYASRFEGAPGANAEELFATAYAACLTQALANTLDWGNYSIEHIETTVQVKLEMGMRSPTFKEVHIIIRARVPGIKENQFNGLANAAKNGCLISRLLKIEPTMEATVEAM